MLSMTKEFRLNIRVTPAFKEALHIAAEWHGLTVSSYVHSLLVKELRKEREDHPEIFRGATVAVAPSSALPTKQQGELYENKKIKRRA